MYVPFKKKKKIKSSYAVFWVWMSLCLLLTVTVITTKMNTSVAKSFQFFTVIFQNPLSRHSCLDQIDHDDGYRM